MLFYKNKNNKQPISFLKEEISVTPVDKFSTYDEMNENYINNNGGLRWHNLQYISSTGEVYNCMLYKNGSNKLVWVDSNKKLPPKEEKALLKAVNKEFGKHIQFFQSLQGEFFSKISLKWLRSIKYTGTKMNWEQFKSFIKANGFELTNYYNA